ncbi:hypothetical protein [Bacillus sp. Marseille-P3661]|uniref:hypothetical protein n=1 Tax=Bacillus sp. Marseille-P3661 TaxID=1936234 RepID=UPI000C84F3C8|nr:hypothetical protein [Bacillus sp. Marseille-P3661]
MDTFLLFILFISISFMDYRRMMKARKVKALVIYTCFLSFAFIMSELHILEVKVIGLNQIVSSVVELFI